jgi:hypothetical protein
MPDTNPLSPSQRFISDWLATNFKAWQITDALTALAAEFDLVAADIIGTGVRVVQLQATKSLEQDDDKFWYESNTQSYAYRDIWAVVEGSPVNAVIIHLDINDNELKARAWAEQEIFRRINA